MFDSKKYWNDRYKRGGTSGPGSYNLLANFKATIINNFIEKNKIKSIVDYGVGDGNQLKLLNTENTIYTGIDVSEFIISECKKKFKNDKKKKFIHADEIDKNLKAELVISCDVIFHLIEDNVYKKYMDNLFSISKKYVIIYSKNDDINHAIHVKFRKFSKYIKNNFQEWKLIKYIPNKYPQLILGKNNSNTSPCEFFIYKKDCEFLSLMNDWKKYIQTELITIVKELNVNLEGNIFSRHNTLDYAPSCLSNKISNIYDVLKKNKPKKILEIGFNAGFSCLLMKLILPDAKITCIDINEHKYVMPCFNKLRSDFNNIYLIPENSYNVALPKLIIENEKYDFIHIDGDHRLKGATKDLELCIKLSHKKTVILFDDTNIKYLDKLCSKYVRDGILKNYCFDTYLNNQKYKHRFFQVNKLPIYISLTSIFKNQNILLKTLKSIMKQSRLPDNIYIFLSEESYMLDSGFENKKITNQDLSDFIKLYPIINVKWVKNTGPYRKLLPLLKDKWEEDCIIITIDDDTIYDTNLIKNLIDDYSKQQCVISYRGFTPLFDKIHNFNYKNRCKMQNLSLYNFTTGKGGVLYKPQFFHKTKNLIFEDNIYLNNCSTNDDIWFYIVRLLNGINCYISNKKWMLKDLQNDGLYSNFNSKNNNNTILFKNTYLKLKELSYNFS